MRAAVFKQPGLPLSLEQLPDPTPEQDEIVLKVGRCGVCGSDLHMTDPHTPSTFQYAPGTTLGHEFAGEVVAIGSAVRRIKVGDRVAALPAGGCGSCPACSSGRPNYCAHVRPLFGAFAEYVLTAEQVALKLPSSLSLADGALIEPLACGLRAATLARMEPGAKVLVIGAGPIALSAIYWARRLGAGNIAVTATSRQRESLAMQMGASAFVVPSQGEDLATLASNALGGMPDVVFECVGISGMLAQSVHCVRPEGTVVVLGFCLAPDAFTPALAVMKEVCMQFSYAYSIQDFEHVARAMDAGQVEPRALITDTISLDELPSAFEALRQRTHQCKVMVDPWKAGAKQRG